MKKFLYVLTIIFTLSGTIAICEETTIFAENQRTECGCSKNTKCLELMKSMYNERATLYNVLNLSNDQQKCKDVIDKKRYDFNISIVVRNI